MDTVGSGGGYCTTSGREREASPLELSNKFAGCESTSPAFGKISLRYYNSVDVARHLSTECCRQKDEGASSFFVPGVCSITHRT